MRFHVNCQIPQAMVTLAFRQALRAAEPEDLRLGRLDSEGGLYREGEQP